MKVEELVAAPATMETGHALLRWVSELRARVLRGEMTIGILPVEEIEKVPALLRRATECGLPAAWFELANWFASPPFGPANTLEAQNELRTAIASGVSGADLHWVRLLWFHRRDEASAKEREEAYAVLTAACIQHPNDAEARHLLGLLTCQGFGTTADPARAVREQQVAASLGSTNALFELFVHHQLGLGVARDEVAALDLVRKAACGGHPRAMYNLGAFHATGTHVSRDSTAALEWYGRAADAGNVRATAAMAVMYAQGDGVERDIEHARQLFDEAEYMGLDVASMREAVGL